MFMGGVGVWEWSVYIVWVWGWMDGLGGACVCGLVYSFICVLRRLFQPCDSDRVYVYAYICIYEYTCIYRCTCI